MALYARRTQTQCGCWYLSTTTRRYIPQVDLKAHSTILSASSRTTLTQTFINPTSGDLEDVKYSFPLHDGVSVVGFKCEINDRVIHGLVKEREEAKAEYQQAVKKGQTAALFEQSTLASDTFTTSIGKIPVGSKAVVEIIYLGELQHDAQADGVRFSIPNVICPRYSSSAVDTSELPQPLATLVQKGAIHITVDVSVDKESSIQGLQSPSHPIAISLGRTSVAAQDVFEANLASATLTMQQGNLFFDKDFVLIVNAKAQDVPGAFLETHPTIPNQRAVMATLVPKFNLPNNNTEIVFIIDRSGSMNGKIKTLQEALRVLLKSLPVGVTFNICSFGSSHSFMWKKSRPYDASSLKAALKYVDAVDSDFGGTEILGPVQATVKNRFKDLDLDVMVLSDGDIWDQQTLFTYVNNAVSDQPIRFFSLGIGNGASQSLIEGIARAGDGFAQFVNDNEQLDKKVVRMLKGALTPHIKDYTAEVVYENGGEDDFEIVEKPNEIPTREKFPPPAKRFKKAMNVDSQEEVPKSKEPISLFDPSYREPGIESATTPLDTNLPTLQPPKVLQAPYKIPSLYPFNRTTVYFLLSPEAPNTAIKSLVLRGTSRHGPLLLKIPVEDIGKGTKLHQLAARKVTQELEEGRGWIYHVKNEKGELIIDEHESKKEDIVKREAVRLGIRFQVSGKYCSFVAVDSTGKWEKAAPETVQIPTPDFGDMWGSTDNLDFSAAPPGDSESRFVNFDLEFTSTAYEPSSPSMLGLDWSEPPTYSPLTSPFGALPPPPCPASLFASSSPVPSPSNTTSLFGSIPTNNSLASGSGGPPLRGGFGSSFSAGSLAEPASSDIDKVLERGEHQHNLLNQTDNVSHAVRFCRKRSRVPSAVRGIARLFSTKAESKSSSTTEEYKASSMTEEYTASSTKAEPTEYSQDKVHALISLQSFEGSWQWEDNVFAIMELNASEAERKLDWASILGKQPGVDYKDVKQKPIVATLLVLAYLNKKCSNEKETWELVGDKAMGWAVEKIREIGGNADRGPDEFLSLFDGLL